MWIRSQNKKNLLNVKEIRVRHNAIICDCEGVILGDYSTDEKALKVLDKIQRHIELINITGSNKDGDTYMLFKQVFEMPQDDEV